MMLAHPQLDAVLDLDIPFVNTLVLEEPRFFRAFLRDIYGQIQGYSGKVVLSEADTPVAFSKHAELIDGLLSFQLGSKQMLNRLTARLEALALREDHYVRTAQIMADLEKHIMDLSFDLPCDIFCGKMSFGGILRAVGIGIPDDYENDLERLLDYMELTRELERERLFIFVNLRSFYPDEDVSVFLSSVISHGHRILLIDSVSRPRLPLERRVTVDVDLCEF